MSSVYHEIVYEVDLLQDWARLESGLGPQTRSDSDSIRIGMSVEQLGFLPGFRVFLLKISISD